MPNSPIHLELPIQTVCFIFKSRKERKEKLKGSPQVLSDQKQPEIKEHNDLQPPFDPQNESVSKNSIANCKWFNFYGQKIAHCELRKKTLNK